MSAIQKQRFLSGDEQAANQPLPPSPFDEYFSEILSCHVYLSQLQAALLY